jgi:hypothetical protein
MMRTGRTMLKDAAMKGRNGDSMIGHLTPGEVVIPVNVARNPMMRQAMAQAFAAEGVPMDRYVVGSQANSVNPETGAPEYFKLKRLAGTLIGGTIGFLVGGPAGAVQGAKYGAQVDAARYVGDQQKQAGLQAAAAQREATAAAEQANQEQALLQRQQVAAQQAQVEQARAALEEQGLRYEAERAEAASRAKEMQDKMDAERRQLGERDASRMRAARRSGARSMLSDSRLNPELGLGASGSATLGRVAA